MSAILPFVYVGLGSMLGGVSRYGMTLATQSYAAFSLPLGTLISNIAGCLLIGLIAGLAATSQILSTEMRLLLATGFCGGFTTMSSFVYELGQFIQDKEYFFAGYFQCRKFIQDKEYFFASSYFGSYRTRNIFLHRHIL